MQIDQYFSFSLVTFKFCFTFATHKEWKVLLTNISSDSTVDVAKLLTYWAIRDIFDKTLTLLQSAEKVTSF